MADILDRWGNKVPGGLGGVSAPPARAFISEGPAALGAALEHATATVTRDYAATVAEDTAERKRKERELEAEARRQEAENKRVRALRATTDFGNDAADEAQRIAEELTTGKVTREKALEQFDEQVAKARDRSSEGIPEEHFEGARLHMDNTGRDLRRRFLGVLEANRREETVANFQAVREGLQRRALRDLPGAISTYEATARTVLTGAGVKADVIEKEIQAFKEHTTYTYVAGLVNAAGNSPRELNALRSVLADPKQYEVLDPERRRVLTATVEHRMDVLEARAERATQQRLNKIGRELDAMDKLAQRGVFPDPMRVDAVLAAAKGTPYEELARTTLEAIGDQRGFMRKDPREMRKELDADQAALAKGGGREADLARVQRREAMYNFTVKQLAEDPLGYHSRTTGEQTPAATLSDPAKLPETLRARADILTALNRSHGAGLGLLRPEEALEWRGALRTMSADQRAGLLRLVYGSVKEGPVYNATLAQLAPDSPVTAFAGQFMAKGDATIPRLFGPDSTIRASEVAVRMLRGEQLLNPSRAQKAEDGKTKGFPMPKAGDFDTYFNNLTGTLFAGNQSVRDTYYQATRALYADLAQDAGDYTGEVKHDRIKRAWEMVSGGGAVRFGQTRVLAPYGMDEEGLRGKLGSEFARAKREGRTSVDPSYLGYAGLRQIDEGRYLVTHGNTFLPDEKTGQPLELDVLGTGAPREIPRPTPKKGR